MNNRKIKFRVWDNKYNCWMQCGFSFSGVGDFISRGGRGFAFQTILDNETLTDKIHEEIPFNGTNPRWVVQQYTGLKDKNGKEIYEGDILYQEDNDEYFKVYWDNGMSGWLKNSINNKTTIYSMDDYSDVMFVVGNIFENPELTKQ